MLDDYILSLGACSTETRLLSSTVWLMAPFGPVSYLSGDLGQHTSAFAFEFGVPIDMF